MIREYLYMFGYESPEERKSNDINGTDYETTGLLYIKADSEKKALEWGKKISEWYVEKLYNQPISWEKEEYAAWIENKPNGDIIKKVKSVLLVEDGEYPDFDLLRKSIEEWR